MSNEHIHPIFAGLLADLAGEKKHLQGQRVSLRPGTNRDRFDGLRRGYQEIVGDNPEPTISFYDFVAGVDAYEKLMAERSLDRQYDHERSRS